MGHGHADAISIALLCHIIKLWITVSAWTAPRGEEHQTQDTEGVWQLAHSLSRCQAALYTVRRLCLDTFSVSSIGG